jgi:hypothetical protein
MRNHQTIDKSRIFRQWRHIPFSQHLIDPRSGHIKWERSKIELVFASGAPLNELEDLFGTLVFD